MARRVEVNAGDRYGRLVVIREVASIVSNGEKLRRVECICDCGVVKEYRLHSLRTGNTRSCGCFVKENVGVGPKKHGLSESCEYRIWQGMKRRCRAVGDACYRHYGGRGIKVCERWSASFEAFYEDMGPRPSDKHSIDRINNDGDYEPSNCRWATSKEQSRNKRVNYLVEHNGKIKCVAEWAEEYGVNPVTLYHRLVKLGLAFDKAVIKSSLNFKRSLSRSLYPHYRVPMRDRDAAWHREHERLEVSRIARDRLELEKKGSLIARTHLVDPDEFKSVVDALLVDGWTWKGAVLRALRELGVVD